MIDQNNRRMFLYLAWVDGFNHGLNVHKSLQKQDGRMQTKKVLGEDNFLVNIAH
jgi:hypothetical protein